MSEYPAAGDFEGMRLDKALVAKGLATSRTAAQKFIAAGRVKVGNKVAKKPSVIVNASDKIRVSKQTTPDYVSRGANKLVAALAAFQDVTVAGKNAFDAGASTGGFTQVLLQAGARHVTSVDVGHGQMAPEISQDARVTNVEGVNLRDFVAADIIAEHNWPVLVVGDVSFISLTLILPQLVSELNADDYILLVKPQFEVGKGNLGSGGIVNDPQLREQALDKVTACVRAQGLDIAGVIDSPLPGTHGNSEYLIWAHKLS